ncbi:TATA box-binding protein-associated factor RNA polymerase I subunit B, partial [Sitophilus oryzae]|uniref:TATA box-binding protein-associated factor RNA polymerase I subunit B n=1 Tax=Sitophilus oryzae TaxID=7048 RepID=A0A6J2XYZ9_SITOR
CELQKPSCWECYNVILKGLTSELIELGAKPELKVVMKCLWMKYLHKSEVFDIKSNRTPKLSIIGSKKDIAILYNVKKRRRRRSTASSISTTLSITRQRSKKKREFVQSQYEELTLSQSLSQSTSLLGETLSSLKSDSEKSEHSAKIEYNKYSKAELKNIMSKAHLKKHKFDISGDMTCHKFLTKDFKGKFTNNPSVLTVQTLYCLLYIGLLIIQDSTQLSDLFRFIREGHLSYGSFRHYFDEEAKDETLNLPLPQQIFFANLPFRKKSAKLAQFLDVAQYIKKPDLIKLCQQFCKEMNLPEEVTHCVEKIIKYSKPQMIFKNNSPEIPNYEGRVMCCIIYVLKLIFGLDGVTEKRFSTYANLLNSQNLNIKMFVFGDWLEYLRYRKVVIKKYNMVANLMDNDNIVGEDYIKYFLNQNIQSKFKPSKIKLQKEANDYMQILSMFADSCSVSNDRKFEASLTPFLDYSQHLYKEEQIPFRNILNTSFFNDSLSFLLKPNKYLRALNTKLVKNCGGNDKIITEDPLCFQEKTRTFWSRRKKNITVRLCDSISEEQDVSEYLKSFKKESMCATKVDILLDNYQKSNKKVFKHNKGTLEIISEDIEFNFPNFETSGLYPEHFNPFERYWLNISTSPTYAYLSRSEMHDILNKLPFSLRVIMKECSRITEQNLRNLYNEFELTELCLVYRCYININKKKHNPDVTVYSNILKSCIRRW